MSASLIIAFRVPSDMRDQIDAYCQAHGTTITDLYRSLTEALLSGQIGPGPVEGYTRAREMAVAIAQVLLAQTVAQLPDTLAEAQARGLVLG